MTAVLSVGVALRGSASARPRRASAPCRALEPLARARWQLAVLTELAQPGHMEMSPVRDRSGRVLDFEWRDSDPLAALTFGCAGEEMFGRRLRKSFASTPLVGPLFDMYLRTLLSGRPQFVRILAGEWSAMHHARPSSQGVKVIVTKAAAVARAAAAQRSVRSLELSELQELRRLIGRDRSSADLATLARECAHDA